MYEILSLEGEENKGWLSCQGREEEIVGTDLQVCPPVHIWQV